MKILLLGATGRLGAALRRRLDRAGHEVAAPGRGEVDLAQGDGEIQQALRRHDFELLVNAAGATNVDACELDPAQADRLNHTAVGTLAAAARARGARLLHFSTDYVFAGDGDGTPLRESDPTHPISAYGRSKLAGEQAVLACDPANLVARVCWLHGPDKPAFPETVRQAARTGGTLRTVVDKWSTPTSCPDIAEWVAQFLAQGLPGGVLHLCNAGGCSWLEYACEVLRQLREREPAVTHDPLVPTPLAAMAMFRAPRPPRTVLDTSRLAELLGQPPRSWQSALAAEP
ncbi:MAG: NAD(P)-dependent oxidoreductase [Verrucomicrobia bacterium]|nr:NAD(P)-dependent oxidoreductase [Verrucomicrobiota bacterium]